MQIWSVCSPDILNLSGAFYSQSPNSSAWYAKIFTVRPISGQSHLPISRKLFIITLPRIAEMLLHPHLLVPALPHLIHLPLVSSYFRSNITSSKTSSSAPLLPRATKQLITSFTDTLHAFGNYLLIRMGLFSPTVEPFKGCMQGKALRILATSWYPKLGAWHSSLYSSTWSTRNLWEFEAQ